MIIANSSPLIVLGRLERLDILESLLGEIFIPNAVYQETVVETTISNQRRSIQKAIAEETIIVVKPTFDYSLSENCILARKKYLT